MTQPIEAAIAAIANVVSGVTGIVDAPNYPNETQNYGPFALTFSPNGDLDGGPVGTRKNLFNVVVQVMVFHDNLPDDMATLTPYLDLIPQALFAEVSGTGQRFNNTISTFEKIHWEYVPLDYGNKACLSYRFLIQNIKILVSQ